MITSITIQKYETNLRESLLTELVIPAFVPRYDGMNVESGGQNIFTLEKRNYENVFITCLTKDNDSCITDPKEILENKGDFIANYILRRIRESTILDLEQNTRR